MMSANVSGVGASGIFTIEHDESVLAVVAEPKYSVLDGKRQWRKAGCEVSGTTWRVPDRNMS
jgi:hypothetical protein